MWRERHHPALAAMLAALALGFFVLASAAFLPAILLEGYAVPAALASAASYLAALLLGLVSAALVGVRPIRRDASGHPTDWDGDPLPPPGQEDRARAFLWLLVLVLAATCLRSCGPAALEAWHDAGEAYGPPAGEVPRSPYGTFPDGDPRP